MRLKHIKLAGFKSFVDPTTVAFPTNLAAVVGPNGCGKSNIIDAVRWVMGESSAKQLRGESLDDVIFNGATTRKPVGQAAIELTFDNSDGTLTGQYASYTEIAVRREIARDGQSSYYLNSTRCRRRDITDLFLGTGLGPRSYAIIEQGMISRVIEAKSDELRAYLEEAAGVSKYKERRHETELRIRHTQENLARVNDIREELSKQINHLQRQANAAEKYKVLKEEERLLKAQIQALRYQLLSEQLTHHTDEIELQQSQLATVTELQQEIEVKLEQERELQSEATQQHTTIQERYYQLGSEISRLEQMLQHQQERQTQWRNEQNELEQNNTATTQQINEAVQQWTDLNTEITTLAPQTEQTKQITEQSQLALTQAEQILQNWQQTWDTANREIAQTDQRVHVEQTRIHHLEQHLQTVKQRMERLQQEHDQHAVEFSQLPHDDLSQQQSALQAQQAEIEQSLQTLKQSFAEQREQNQQYANELDNSKHRLQTLSGQQASLEALQQAALGQQEETVVNWLKQFELSDHRRLAQLLQVEPGWERAVEIVLDKYLQAVCVDDIKTLDLNNLPQGNLSFVAQQNSVETQFIASNTPNLLSKINAPYPLNSLLTGIYVANTLQEALDLSSNLAANESIITRDGIWLGNNWLSTAHKTDATGGVIQRERELTELKNLLNTVSEQIQQQQNKLHAGQDQLRQLEQQRETLQQQQAELVAAQAELRAQQQVRQARLTQAQQRAQQINNELHDCAQQIEQDQSALQQARNNWQEAQEQLQQQTLKREELTEIKLNHQTNLDEARQQAQRDRDHAHQLALRLQAVELQLTTTQQNRTRLQQQLQQLTERQNTLEKLIAESSAPLLEVNEQLQSLCDVRATIENELNASKQQIEQREQQLRQLEKQRQEIEQSALTARNKLEQVRLAAQESQVRSRTLQEQITESGHEIETLLKELPADANDTVWEEQLAQTTRKIERLGPINLAAIEEFQTHTERKDHLDTQYNDLTEALATLETAISKMDKETKGLFKQTYDQVNGNFQALFPRLFGGGRASLELTGDDLLEAGVTVMAQPPGKRNSTIHLLSGGEKALTAIALVFSLFQLNPAPFCMLDEVDAPLDDANVVRFCNLVKEMSDKIQFIFISHNKLAIEMAQQLAGVTMHEAGVSRLVAVDMEEAIALATA